MKTRIIQRTYGHFWWQRQALIIQVLDAYEPSYNGYGVPDSCRTTKWRDIDPTDLQNIKVTHQVRDEEQR